MQMLDSLPDAAPSVVLDYATRALALTMDLMSSLSPDLAQGSERGSPWPEVTPLNELVAAARWGLHHWGGDPAQAIKVERRQGVDPVAYWRELVGFRDTGEPETFGPQRTYEGDLAGCPVQDLLEEIYPLLADRVERLHPGDRERR